MPLPYPGYCPEGSICSADYPWQQSQCTAGHYCALDTTDAGVPCPTGIRPTAHKTSWELTTYCEAGMTTLFAGALSLKHQLRAGGHFAFICPLHYNCPNASVALPCPAGHYCEHAANESLPCTADWFGMSAEESCPEGTIEDRGSAYGQLIILAAAAVPLVLLLEIVGCLLKRWARMRHVKVADQADIQESKQAYSTYTAAVRRRLSSRLKRQTKTKKSFSRRLVHSIGEYMRSGSSGESIQSASAPTPTAQMSSGSTSTADQEVDIVSAHSESSATPQLALSADEQQRARNVNHVLDGATLDQVRLFNALLPAQAAAMPADEDAHWIMASIANGNGQEDDDELGCTSDRLGEVLPTTELRGQCFLHISLRGLDFHIGRARVLKNLYCDCSQGQLVALLGESGSGKSTLLNVLGGRSSYGEISAAPPMRGALSNEHSAPILLNEMPYHPQRLNAIIGFVPQAHIIFKELTVFENLLYASQMRAARSMSSETRMRLVDMALDLLGLKECQHFVCDPSLGERLSGGQMRRIGIGVELVCDPPIMLLDEPTSALDAVNTRLVVTALKNLTKRGILVIASLHQPRESVFSMFDKLWLMRKGELAYGGRVDESVDHFALLGYHLPSRCNPADFFIEVCFGMQNEKAAPGATSVENLAAAWTIKAAKEGRRSVWAHDDPASTRRAASRAKIRDTLLKELKWLDEDLYHRLVSPFPGARVAAVVHAELKRVWEEGNKRVDKQTWIENYWTRSYGALMSEDVRDELWEKAKARAKRLHAPRTILDRLMEQFTMKRKAVPKAAQDISRSESLRARMDARASVAGSAAGRVGRTSSFSGSRSHGFHAAAAPALSSTWAPGDGRVTDLDAPTAPTAPAELSCELPDDVWPSVTASEVPSPHQHAQQLLNGGHFGPAAGPPPSPAPSPPPPPPLPPSAAPPSLHSVDPHVMEDGMAIDGIELQEASAPSGARSNLGSTHGSTPACTPPAAAHPTPLSSFERDQRSRVATSRAMRFPWLSIGRSQPASERASSSSGSPMSSFRDGLRFKRSSSLDKVDPTLADLEHELRHWNVTVRVVPGWRRHFQVCLKRGLKKMVRKRKLLYAKFASVLAAAVVCGIVCFVLRGDRNLLAILYMLCNALFATVVATGSIDVLGNREERLLLEHEAASGVKPSAEALSRILVDLLVLAPLGPLFAVPLQALSLMPVGTLPLIALYEQIGWAMATVGYVFSLLAPSNSTLLTAAISLILFAFFSGPLIGPSFLPSSAHILFWANPGFAGFLQMGLGNAVRMPFSLTRWRLIQLFMESEIMPADVPGSQLWEYDWSFWYLPSVASLLACGLLLRLVAIGIFSVREVQFERAKYLKKGCAAWLCGRGSSKEAEPEMTPVVPLSSHPVNPSRVWKIDPGAPESSGCSAAGEKVAYMVRLPPGFAVAYAKDIPMHLIKYPEEIETTLPSGARLIFTPHRNMRPGDLVEFSVPASTLVAREPDSQGRRHNPTEIFYGVDTFKERSAHTITDEEREKNVPVLVVSDDVGRPPSSEYWKCRRCTFDNHQALWECECCGLERPGKLEHVRRHCVPVVVSAPAVAPSERTMRAAWV